MLFLPHSSDRNSFKTMPRCNTVIAIRKPLNSSSGAEEGLEFIFFVGGQQPQSHEVWIFSDDGITREVHSFARIDVALSLETVSRPITFLKVVVECLFTAKSLLM